MKKVFKHRTLTDMTVDMECKEDFDLKALNGKVMVNEADKNLLFVQDAPRRARSKELARTRHSRLVRNQQGNYTLTFRFTSLEGLFASRLLKEMVEVIDTIENQNVVKNN